MRQSAAIVILVGVAASAAAPLRAEEASAGDYVILSDKWGDIGYIGLPVVGRNVPDEPVSRFATTQMSSGDIGALFAGLCLAKPFDRASYSAALAAIAPDFASAPRSLAYFETPRPLLGVYKVPAVQITQERSDYGLASLWAGEGADGVKNRQVIRYSGGLVVTGPVEPESFYSPQCNLALHVSGLTSAAAMFDGIQRAVAQPTVVKRVEKPKYGYAVWTFPGEQGRIARITANAAGFNKSSQTVHLVVQSLPAGTSK